MTLTRRSALVTGSTSGIGLAIARALAREGANVMINGFGDAEEIAALCRDLAAEFGVEVDYDGADLSDPAAAAALVRTTQARFGSLDILVNNAGIQFVAPIEEFPAARWDAIIAINLSSVFHTMSAAIPSMKARGWGRIINVASAHGLVASPFKVAYVAAKHGVVGATKVAAIELANDGVTVNAICPGWVLTPLVERQLQDRARDAGTDVLTESGLMLAEKQPMHRFTSPESIGAMAVFLCSEAASTITGAPLSIDGGWVAQ
ncbi:MAG TPA: 3-hydroxybutyrate dehydrogenase [Acidimicrobiales bacterium]|nr:3-hydroxybutyrate dehydrogenase [Acidimicrobiales bacterium]